MVKFNRFSLMVALSSLALWIPTAATPIYGRSSAYAAIQYAAVQQEQPSQPPTAQEPNAPPDQQRNVPETKAPSQQKQTVMLTGTIVQQNGEYVLKGSEQTYKLDAQNKAKGFEGRKVRVIGTLDTASNMVQVDEIKPAV